MISPFFASFTLASRSFLFISWREVTVKLRENELQFSIAKDKLKYGFHSFRKLRTYLNTNNVYLNKNKMKKVLSKYIRLIGLLILAYIITRIDFKALLVQFKSINLYFLFAAIFMNLFLIFAKAIRWKAFLIQQNLSISTKSAFSIYLSSLYIGFITPGRLGEISKALYLKQKQVTSFYKGLSGAIMDRLLDLYFLILLGSVGVYYLSKGKGINLEFVFLFVIVLSLPIIILHPKVLNLLTRILFRKISPKKFKDKIRESVNEFIEGINQIVNPFLLYGILLTVFSYSLFFFQCFLIAKSIGLQISYFELALIMSIVNIITLIPISISGLGTREASMIFLFKLIGLPTEAAISFSLLIFFVFFICGGLMGFIAWWLNPVKIDFSKKEKASTEVNVEY